MKPEPATRLFRFPPRRAIAIWVVEERNGDGWLAIAGSHGWLFGSRADATAEARWLSHNLGLPVRETSS
jgi:hypothetical protein